MPLTVVYDSGSVTGIAPDIWHEYRVAVSPVILPFWVVLKLDPFQEVSNTWNLWGYACLECNDRGGSFLLPQTELSAAGAGVPSGGTSKRAGLYTLLKALEIRQAGTRVSGFSAVHFCVHRWVGPTRVRVGFVS